ncbi:hypothetical protein ACHAW5_008714 [Stephanodiscus triporus]|uniref:Uncharacterized protein n=1 Tax=Stephanodiscus triporus TaxID=2934178 RepID=A0ABD3NL01_9STRA
MCVRNLIYEQSPGRIRFIFLGEWIDGSAENYDGHDAMPKSVLNCPPGDDDSIESRWMTWDEVHVFTRESRVDAVNLIDSIFEHEPITSFGMLEQSWRQNFPVPGLQVHPMNLLDNNNHHEGAAGSFFGGLGQTDIPEKAVGLTYHGRAALLTHLQCRLLVYNKIQNSFAMDARKHPQHHLYL